jgi:hypothetical protein
MKFLKRAEKIFQEASKYDKEYKKPNDFARISLPGSTQSIVLGDDFIHQTIHDDKVVTVNLCLRTTTLPNLDLYSFVLNGYKIKNDPYNEMKIRKLSLIKTLPEAHQIGALAKFLETANLLTLVNLIKGDQFAANYFNEDFKEETKKCIKRRFPKDYQKLRKFLDSTSNPLKLHKKLKFFIKE